MDLHLTLEGHGPLRRRIERELREAVRKGSLAPGVRLPPSRGLARQLGVSRGTVVEAYSQLVAEGTLVARRGGGTRVADLGSSESGQSGGNAAGSPAPVFDLRPGAPDPAAFPRAAWSASLGRVLHNLPDAALMYGNPRGSNRLRLALSRYLGRARGARVRQESLVSVAGMGLGMFLLGRAMAARGVRRVAVEDPGWSRHQESLELAGLEIVGVPVDEEGLDVAALRDLAVGAVVVTPAHQYPTGAVLSPGRRAALIAWAREQDALVIEDDYDAEYRYDGRPVGALQGLAPDLVAYAGTASKTLSPALRLAWLALPDDLVEAVLEERGRLGAGPASLIEATVADLIDRGEWDRHLRRTRLLYRRRHDVLLEALSGDPGLLRIGGASAGLHLMAWLPQGIDEERVAVGAAQRGIALGTLRESCRSSDGHASGLVLGYSAAPEPTLERAAEQLLELLRELREQPSS